MTSAKRPIVEFIPLFAAAVAIVPAVVTIIVGVTRDPTHDRCALAVQYVGEKSPNPDISAADRIKLSSAMAHRALECVQ